jgi:hypothetical protein
MASLLYIVAGLVTKAARTSGTPELALIPFR